MPDDKDDSFQASMIALHGSMCSADLDYLQVSTPKARQQIQQFHKRSACHFQCFSPYCLSNVLLVAAGCPTGLGAQPSAFRPELRSRRCRPDLHPGAADSLRPPHPGFQHHPRPSRPLPVTAPPGGRGLVVRG